MASLKLVGSKMDEVVQAQQAVEHAAAAASGWAWLKSLPFLGKIFSIFGAGFAIAAYFVMTATKRGTDEEFRRGLAATFVFAIFGGSGAIRYLGISNWLDDFFGAMALCGLVILCGVPGWLIVKTWFNFANKNKDSELPDLAKKLKDAVLK